MIDPSQGAVDRQAKNMPHMHLLEARCSCTTHLQPNQCGNAPKTPSNKVQEILLFHVQSRRRQ